MKSKSTRNAFTLVEILVVLSVISIMAVMVTTALRGVTATARESRTKRIISIVDSVISEQYEAFRYRPLAVEIPLSQLESAGTTVGYEVLADEAARVRLMMIRDLQRMELPDRYTDITGQQSGPTPIWAAATKIVESGDQILRDQKRNRIPAQVAWYGFRGASGSGDDVPAKLSAYRQRLSGRQTPAHEGAECLYLILATSFVGGEPAIAAIPSSNIGDTDGDGMPEILDGWGNPLGFIRWPVGYTPSKIPLKPSIDFEETVDLELPDQFDLFRSDFAYIQESAGDAWVRDINSPGPTKRRPWSMQPLIFSFGGNGQSAIIQDPPGFSGYRTFWDWPADAKHCGNEDETGGRNASYRYPDPYLRRYSELNPTGNLPGELVGDNASDWKESARQASDNITNYQLQVSP